MNTPMTKPIEFGLITNELHDLRRFRSEAIQALREIPLGRLYCGYCGEWDHQCGCSPDVIDRTRAEVLKRFEEAGL